MEGPHRIVTKPVDGLATGAQNIVKGVMRGAKGAGTKIQTALDTPFRSVGKIESPAHVPGRLLDGAADGFSAFIADGWIGTLRAEGHGIERALDHPVEQFSRRR